tara:strand:- start:8987 stop:9535 length:549 start_codon:yes stop_codon:yes gene_type:complete
MYDDDYSGPYLKKFAIPFWRGEINDWDSKKEQLWQIFDRFKKNFVEGDQLSDYDSNRQYHFLLEGILMDDLIRVKKDFGYGDKQLRINSAWFQQYEKKHTHYVHNHGFGGFSSVLYLKFDPEHHQPTVFVAPYVSNMDGNVLEYIPEGVTEGTLIVFPTSLAHYVPVNRSEESRVILSMNIN